MSAAQAARSAIAHQASAYDPAQAGRSPVADHHAANPVREEDEDAAGDVPAARRTVVVAFEPPVLVRILAREVASSDDACRAICRALGRPPEQLTAAHPEPVRDDDGAEREPHPAVIFEAADGPADPRSLAVVRQGLDAADLNRGLARLVRAGWAPDPVINPAARAPANPSNPFNKAALKQAERPVAPAKDVTL